MAEPFMGKNCLLKNLRMFIYFKSVIVKNWKLNGIVTLVIRSFKKGRLLTILLSIFETRRSACDLFLVTEWLVEKFGFRIIIHVYLDIRYNYFDSSRRIIAQLCVGNIINRFYSSLSKRWNFTWWNIPMKEARKLKKLAYKKSLVILKQFVSEKFVSYFLAGRWPVHVDPESGIPQ